MSSSKGITTASPRQLRFLKSLARETETSFAYPENGAQANAEIKRLLALKARLSALPGEHEQAEEREHAQQSEEALERELTYATAVEREEVSGYGATATWKRTSRDDSNGVGERTELARYSVSAGDRVLYGQRINGCVRITDRPASGSGRSYLVESQLEQDGYSALKSLVADYLQQAKELDQVPIASGRIRRDLELASDDV